MPPVFSKLSDVLPQPSGVRRCKKKVLGCLSRPPPIRGAKMRLPRSTKNDEGFVERRHAAADAVQSGQMSYREAVEKFQVKKSTIRDLVTGRAGKGKTGPSTSFTEQEEAELVWFKELLCDQRFPMDWEGVRRVAGEIVRKSSNPHRFPNGEPSEYNS